MEGYDCQEYKGVRIKLWEAKDVAYVWLNLKRHRKMKYQVAADNTEDLLHFMRRVLLLEGDLI